MNRPHRDPDARPRRTWIVWFLVASLSSAPSAIAEPLPPRSSTIEPHDWQQTVTAVLWATGLLIFVMLMIMREWRRARLRNAPPTETQDSHTP